MTTAARTKTLKTRTRVATLAMIAAALAPATALAQDGDVVDGKNADPNEIYNLPPNFDDNYKPKKTPKRVKVTVDFRDAPLTDVVKFFSSVLQRNFIISNSIQANKTINIITPKPVSQTEAYRAFLEALNMNGLTIVRVGSFYKIVDAKTAAKEVSRILTPNQSSPNDANMITAIIPVENTPVEELQKVVQSFVSANATIVTYDNQLILTDTGANIRRLKKLVKRLDQDGKSGNVYVYKVAHAEAGEVQQKLSEIFEIAQGNNNARNPRNSKVSAKSAEGGGDELDVSVSQIIADERTNQLIIVSDERSFRKISQMLELLDVPTEVGGQIHVKFLEYADAEELSGTLSTLASNTGQRNNNRNNARRGTVNSAAAASNPQAAQLLSGEVQVTAHTPTNSLIIVASPRDYMSLERVVNLLDRPRRQVWVEAVIMEISLGQQNDTSIGFNGGVGQDFDGLVPQSAVDDGLVSSTTGLVLGQSNFGDGFTSVLGAPGGALGLLGPSLTIPGIELTIPAFAMFLQATQTDSNINVLSTPSLLALDNEESEIVVGDRVPFPQGAVGQGGVAGLAGLLGGQAGAAAGGLGGLGGLLGGGLLNQVTYEDVGITLRIKPQVNESKYVRLEVDQEVSSVGAPTDFGPTRSKRSIKTIVLVKDQSTVVIGGLIRDDENDSETKVPFLGDIPLLGLLFRTTNTTKTKQNLVLMLTPYIIESEADLKKIRERKRKERQELLRLFQRRDAEYMSRVDYGKKSGVIDRMRRNISEAKVQEAARRQALEAFEQTGPRYQILGTTPKPAGGGGEKKPGAVPVTDDGE